MGIIKPTLTLTANANSATTDAGPLSIALSLSTTLSLTVDKTQAKSHTFASATDHFTIIDSDTEDNGSEEAGINGCFVYIKNISSSDLDAFVGNIHDAAAEDLSGNADQTRLFTLRQNEFAFFPWDYTTDLITDAASGAKIEYFVFNRANT
jgi:hypothetical protein|tara:strand:+ start:56 stop:508 length:453 start_codon:yes stop_codon:yes gene_type:complete